MANSTEPSLKPVSPILAAMKIYTKTGDRGETGLFGGERVLKSHERVQAYGEVDELNAWLGVVRAHEGLPAEVVALLIEVQKTLFAIGGRLADPSQRIKAGVAKVVVDEPDIQQLERMIDTLETELPPLRRFILPGGRPAGAALHVARTICRRAERAIVALGTENVEAHVIGYINRLSDLLFVLARATNHRAGQSEIEW